MIDRSARFGDPAAGLRRSYRLALLAVAVLTVVAHLVMKQQIQTQLMGANVINRAGRQRMLSQKIAKEAVILQLQLTQTGRPTAIRNLKDSVRELNENHAWLTREKILKTPAIELKIRQLDPHIRKLTAAAEQIADKKTAAAALATILENEATVLKQADQIVTDLTHSAQDANQDLINLGLIVVAFTFVVLVAEAAFVFRPAANLIESQVTALNRRIRDAEAATKQAELAAQAKADFLASMSHEIRTPLNGIIGMASIVADGNLAPEQHQQLETVLSSANTLLTILNDILDYSKIEAGMIELERIPFNLPTLIEDTVANFEPLAQQKQIQLICHIHESVPEMAIGDPTRFRQVLSNLISNGIKFTDRGQVCVEVAFQDSNMVTEVVGTGIGISLEAQKKIFHRFTQADRSTSRKYGGTGLGLAICQFLTEAMGGRIEVDSVLNQVSTFRIVIPFDVVQGSTTDSAHLEGEKILCVDDNAVNLEVLSNYIRAIGGVPLTAATVDEAVDLFLQNRDSVAMSVLDMEIGASDGIQLAHRLRKFGDQPMILLSSVLMNHHLSAEAREMFSAILMKPIRRQSLRNSVMHAVHPPAIVAKVTDAHEGRRKLRVLVVEDNLVNQMVAKGILKARGDDFTIAADGISATHAWESGQFDVILMDISLPDIDGLELTRRIRTSRTAAANIPIIGFTASALEGDRDLAMAAGMNAFLTKPIDRAALFAELDQI
jgi:signal transduction histidine kinase/DNA-binding response OmpR family regulator